MVEWGGCPGGVSVDGERKEKREISFMIVGVTVATPVDCADADQLFRSELLLRAGGSVCMCVCVCARARARVRVCARVCVHAYVCV